MQRQEVTALLQSWHRGDDAALEALVPLVYEHLREMAHRRLRRERDGHTLDTGALVHEAFLRLVDVERVEWQSRAHFLAMASTTMRRVLVDYARRRAATRRGGGAAHLSLHENPGEIPSVYMDGLPDLDDALSKLENVNERAARTVEQRYFGGLSLEETAEIMGVSLATAKRDLRFARAWLARELDDVPHHSD